jgi:hypothetical protein
VSDWRCSYCDVAPGAAHARGCWVGESQRQAAKMRNFPYGPDGRAAANPPAPVLHLRHPRPLPSEDMGIERLRTGKWSRRKRWIADANPTWLRWDGHRLYRRTSSTDPQGEECPDWTWTTSDVMALDWIGPG